MGELKLHGIKAVFDEIMATAIKRQHEPQRIVGDLLNAEINEKRARSINYQFTIAKLPLSKDIAVISFDGTPINQTLVNDLAGGGFTAQQRNVVLVGGTGTGKTHLAIAIARNCIRSGARGRFYNVVDLVNRLEIQTRCGRQGRLAEHLSRMDSSSWTNSDICPSPSPVASSCSISSAASTNAPPSSSHQSRLRRMAEGVRRCQDDHRTARSADPPLRHRRDRQRQLAIQKPRRRSHRPRSSRLRNPGQLRRDERYQQNSPPEGVKIGRR